MPDPQAIQSQHEPASDLIHYIYQRELGKPDPRGRDTIVLTAGGSGTGKSSALEPGSGPSVLDDVAKLRYDTTLSDPQTAQPKIQMALDSGHRVIVAYVHADPLASWTQGVLPRMAQTGRPVPISEHVSQHVGAITTVQSLLAQYQGDPRVAFVAIDHTRPGHAVPRDAGFISTLQPPDPGQLATQCQSELGKWLESGRIDANAYRAAIGDASGGGAATVPPVAQGSPTQDSQGPPAPSPSPDGRP